MVQITNQNVAQAVRMKLEGYSTTSTAARVTLRFTNQYSGYVTTFARVTPTSTNGRYQEMTITPPANENQMSEGLYILEVLSENEVTLYATRLAFVAPDFSESTYTSYTEGDTDAYNVYHKQ